MNVDAKDLLARFGPKELRSLKTDWPLGTVRFSPCGSFLFAGGLDGTVRRWRIADDEFAELAPLAGHNGWVQAIAPAPGPAAATSAAAPPVLFTADSWGQLRCWSLADPEPTTLWSVADAHDGWIRAVATSPDGKLVATCGRDQAVRVWSAVDGAKRLELTGHGEDVFCLAFHPDGRSLVSGDFKGVLRHWDLGAGACMRDLDATALFKLDRLQDVGGARCLAFDRDGTLLACGGTTPKVGANVQGQPTIMVFDWQTGMRKHTLTLGGEGDGFVYDMHFHRDGFLMVVTSGNPGSGKFLFIRPGDKEPFFVTTKLPNCHSLAMHTNGTRLAVTATNGGSNGNGRQLDKDGNYPGNWSPVHIWDMPAGMTKA
jgi:WD40 repeat protein